MYSKRWDQQLRTRALNLGVLGLIACATMSVAGAADQWKEADLVKALAAQSRPQDDRNRDDDRKPAQLMTFIGVEKGMTALDVIGVAGYMTEVLSVTVGKNGKVYLHNPPMQANAAAKAIDARLAGGRLPNVVRVDGEFIGAVPSNSVDVAVTAMNLHDVYNRGGAPAAVGFMKGIYSVLEPGGIFGVIDHVGNAGDNAQLHRMTKQQAIDAANASGFVVEAESNLLARSTDDHTKTVFDPSVRGKTDQFVLRLRKPVEKTQ